MLIVAGLVVLVALVTAAADRLLGLGPIFVVIVFVVVVAGSLTAYWKSDAVALALSHAKPADPGTFARLHNLVEGLCIADGLPKPRIYVVDDPAPNAFATGRNPRHAAVAVTTGLLEKMNRIELEGVLAHELSHVKNYDILSSTLAVTFVGMVVLLADLALGSRRWDGPRPSDHDDDDRGPVGTVVAGFGFALLILAPLVARVMQSAVSRRREAVADFSGVQLTRYPPGLLAALEKLRDETTVVHSGSRATAHLWIGSPLACTPEQGRLAWLNRLFDTHPPLEERIQALKEL